MMNQLIDGVNPYLATDRQKQASDQELVRKMVDYYSTTCQPAPEEVDRMRLHLNLHVGRWPGLSREPVVQFAVPDEVVTLGGGSLNHYPLIDRYSSQIVGLLILRPLSAFVKDASAKARNERERYKIGRIQEHMNALYIDPVREQVRKQVQQELGVEDPFSLGNKEIEEFEKAVSEGVQMMLPDAIKDAMERYRLPGEIVMQSFLDDYLARNNVKSMFDVGGEFAVATGHQYYMIEEANNTPRLRVLSPTRTGALLSVGSHFVEDGIAASYSEILSPEEFVAYFGHAVTRDNLRKILSSFSPVGTARGGRDGYDDGPHTIASQALDTLERHPGVTQDFRPMTRDGQDILKSIYQNLPVTGAGSMGISRQYTTFRWTRDAVRVTRVDPKTGRRVVVFRPATYEKSGLHGDIKVERILVPQVWHANKVGDGDSGLLIGAAPVSYQYNDLSNPFNVKLTIFGGSYNTLLNEVRGTSFVGNAKPWQYRYNVLMKKKEEKEATDLGKVLLGTFNMKPKSWSWTQFFQSLMYTKFGPIRTHGEGLQQVDTSVLRAVDLSNAAEYARVLDELAYVEKMMMSAMYVSPAMMGETSQYATNQVSQMNQAGGERVLLKFNEWHRQVKQSTMNGLLRAFFATYKDNESIKSRVLDDYGRAYFDSIIEDIDSFYELYVVDDFEESGRVQRMQELMLSLMQNGARLRDISDIVNAKSMAEVNEIADRADRYREKQEAARAENEQAMMAAQEDMKRQLLELKMMFDAEQKERDRMVKLQASEMHSDVLRKANDVNDNKIADALERDMFKQTFEEAKLRAMVELKNKELDLRYGRQPDGTGSQGD